MIFAQTPNFYFEVASRIKHMFVAEVDHVAHECRDLSPEKEHHKNIYSELERDLRTY